MCKQASDSAAAQKALQGLADKGVALPLSVRIKPSAKGWCNAPASALDARFVNVTIRRHTRCSHKHIVL